MDKNPPPAIMTPPRTSKSDDESEGSRSLVQSVKEKLGRAKSLGGKGKASPSKSRLFSLNKKKENKSAEADDLSVSSPTQMEHSGISQSSASSEDPSPFIQPPPLTAPQRPSIGAFTGAGSMRAGTQTLIQALQAIPWAEDRAEGEAEDDIIPHQLTPVSDDEDEGPGGFTLASSIHTIHRPVARHLRGETPLASGVQRPGEGPGLSYFAGIASDDEEEDFEEDKPASPGLQLRESTLGKQPMQFPMPRRGSVARQGSLATVRLQRRARLAEKLKEVFSLDEIREVVAEMPCWLLRSVLLQGYMYLTNAYLCFFAHMPSREDQILKSGTLSKKTQRTKRWTKHWFVLKNDVLSWYQSSADPYFPHGAVDLRYAISCEPAGEKGIRLRTNQKTVHLSADSVPSREEWVKAIRKVIFKAQNMGESVKIAIPYSVILDVDKSSAMDFSETIEVKVIDKEENFAVDSYFFAYFHDLPQALEQIRDAVHAHRHSNKTTSATTDAVVRDTTSNRVSLGTPPNSQTQDRTQSMPGESKAASTSSFRLTSLLRPFTSSTSGSLPVVRSSTTPTNSGAGISDRPPEEFTHVEVSPIAEEASSPTRSSFLKRPCSKDGPAARSAPESIKTLTPGTLSTTSAPTQSSIDHTYPPPPSPYLSADSQASSSWSVPVPAWLRNPSRHFFSSSPVPMNFEPPQAGVSEVYSSAILGRVNTESSGEMGFSILEENDPSNAFPDPNATEKFRATFALDDREALLGYVPGSLFRVLPVSGRAYISTNYFCFRSSQPLVKTKMIIPIRDILAVEKQKAFRFGYSGLVVIIKGYEELFFEFSGSDRRNACVDLLERQMEVLRERAASGEVPLPSQGKRDALILEELEPSSLMGEADPRPPPETMTDSLPAVMFTSNSSTFLTFKPEGSLHFTCLTIGSRGDVQPYIALCKGLKADGHRVRIATHLEFKNWVEGHGIEYGYVGGDPAELMRICVENGTFTVSFLKEGVQKFRGWIDDLLKTSWEACQGTDVLIESPSAMGGLHIAEALRIPYYRAFTMPWTRTRAYPHAFAVPERKMGGSYNYMTYVMFDQVFWRGTAGQINRWRRNVLRIGGTNLDKMEQHKVPFLYNFSPTIVPPPLDWYEWIRVTGYWFLDDADDSAAKKWTPPPKLVRFIDDAHAAGKKVVYIGFGSIVVSDPDSMTRCVVEAIQQSGVYAILSKGWSDRLATKKSAPVETEDTAFPPQIYPIASVPHDWLFRKIDAACHHGGAGTTGASLRAGIPTIIRPFFGDQFFWADRVEALGIGSSVRKMTVENLTAALRTATTDQKQIARAKLIGQTIRSENGVATAIEAIYRDLEYARSLVKQRATNVEFDESADSDDGAASPLRNALEQTMEGSMEGSNSSAKGGAPSEDWSVISEEGSPHLRAVADPRNVKTDSPSKRTSIAAATLTALHDALSYGSNSTRGSSHATTQ